MHVRSDERLGVFTGPGCERYDAVSLFAILVALCLGSTRTWGAERVEYNRDVRPILADNCFPCHGPDAARRQADLRLDLRDAALEAAALVPGKPAESQLIARVFSSEPHEVMPPPESNKRLSPAEKELLRRWIADGAEYQGHWAFITPQVPDIPRINGDGPINPIDHFIRQRLQQEGLTPAPEADRVTLLRRLALDLTGIPPTPDEVDAFVADASPEAYEKAVDRLLASPRYGERMAMHWLDYARYADSNGFQTDSSRQMWRWRDWVIDAFNRNLPFDQFTIEQLAGDLLAQPRQDQLVATGFHRNTRLNGEGGRIVEEWFAETVIDRVETTGLTWLALTVGCSRCHDHKYDPLTQKEFYQLFAFFNSIDESGVLDSEGGGRSSGNSRPLLTVPTETQLLKQKSLEAAIVTADEQVATTRQALAGLQSEWEAKFARQVGETTAVWKPLEPAAVVSRGGASFKRLEDGSWLATGQNPNHDLYTITAPLKGTEFSGLRLEVLPDASLPNQSLGRAFNGNFVLTAVEAELTAASLPKPVPVTFVRAATDYEQKGYEVSSIVSSPPGRGWAIDGNDPAKRLARKAMFLADAVTSVPPDATLIIRLKHDSSFADHNVGRFRLSWTELAPNVVKLEGTEIPETVLVALKVPAAERSAEQRDVLAAYFRDHADHPHRRAIAAAAEARKQLAEFQASLPTTMVMKELPQPRDAFILKRGEYDKPSEKVVRGLPAALPPLPHDAPVNRLGFARWLVSPDHPLTARVWVNRQWEKFFGTGLVKTVDNFGLQSEPPSHPELLDWLATEFVRLKWDMKELQKTIVMSATYRQSSPVSAELLARDPENRLLARGPRFRLPAELVRDQALAVSGLLVERIGGPSVRPYMPEGVWDETSKYGDLRGYQHDRNDGLYRRTLYTIWKRTAAPPTMLMFDSPSREVCTVKRSRTNTPLQALALLNELTYVESARVLGQKMIEAGGETPRERITWAFRRVTSRTPHATELEILVNGFERQRSKYQQRPDDARKLISLGQSKPAVELDPAELAAYTLTANILLNLDEVVTKE
jgi:hypothetical protein